MAEGADDERATRCRIEQQPCARQGLDQIAPRQPVHRAEQIADGVALALVDDRERRTPRLGQPQLARAGIITSPYACDPVALLEARNQAAQIARVHVERILQHGRGDGLTRRDLEQQPRFGQGRLSAEELAVERADRLVKTIAAQKGMKSDVVDEIVARVESWLERNRRKA